MNVRKRADWRLKQRARVERLEYLETLFYKNPPYSGTCPVPLFSSSLTRLPPALMSSMARAWVMSRVLSPLISMIWSPTCSRHTERGGWVDFCQLLFIHGELTFSPSHSLLMVRNWGISAFKCLVQVHLNRSCWGRAESYPVVEFTCTYSYSHCPFPHL